ncbi:MAG: leucine-rich repeat domain-containing protein [Clostridia bacterium]|nr:leucine-rich repeat domain-containing protein [Clostridia bacterium]
MQTLLKKPITILLSLLMVLSVFGGLTFTASAATVVETGSCGDSATYTLDSDGLLTISGSGQVAGDLFVNRTDIRKVVIEEGITGLSMRTFKSCNFEEISLPDSLTSYDTYSFWACSNFETLVFPRGITAIDHYFCYECTGLKTLIIMAEDLTMFKGFTLNTIPAVETVKFAGSEEQCGRFVDDYYFRNITVEYDCAPVNVGDTIQFGTYPQTKVTDSALIAALDAAEKTWMSYNYYSGTYPRGNSNCSYDGLQQPGDWMRYADFFYGGEKYRAVTFDLYRPRWLDWAAETTGSAYNNVYSNGYRINTVYYFKYEPLNWQVLDPDTGFVLCQNVIDSQGFCNTPYYSRPYYFKGIDSDVKACIYETSDLRIWLNDDFYLTAFSESQKANIKTAAADAVNDKVLLLTKTQANNADYGLTTDSRATTGTDYAKAQGLSKDNNSVNAIWSLRTWSAYSNIDYVKTNGELDKASGAVIGTIYGVRPACYLEVFANSVAPSELLLSEHLSEGHTYGDPTWTWADNHTGADAVFTCSVCGKTITVTDNAPETVDVSAATCTEDQIIKYTAKVTFNDVEYTTETGNIVVPNTAHHTLINHDAQAPTCTEIGWDAYRTCENCDYTEYVEIPANGHAYVNHDAQTPTCTEIGWEAYRTCENCDYTEYVEIPANGHAYVNHDAQAPTCTAIGWDAFRTCENCDYTEYVELPANGHAYVNHDAKAPTCTAIGWDAYRTCENCDYTEYVEIPANGHAYVNHDAQAPTCTEIGWEAYRTCENCDYTEYVEIPANGHAYVNHDAQAPTCTEIGWEAYRTCENCDYTEYVELPANGHAYVNHDAQAPTCTEIGWNAYRTCENCDYTTYVEIPATDHDYRFDSFVWAADNTAKAKLICANDADHVTLVDAAVTSETTAPTATEDGFTVYTAIYESHSEEKTVVDEGSATGEVTPSDPADPIDGEKIHGEHCFCYNVLEDSFFGSLLHFLCGIICALINFLSAIGVAA